MERFIFTDMAWLHRQTCPLPPFGGGGGGGGGAGAACSAARAIAITTPSRFFITSSLVKRSTRYPRDANHSSRRPSWRKLKFSPYGSLRSQGRPVEMSRETNKVRVRTA